MRCVLGGREEWYEYVYYACVCVINNTYSACVYSMCTHRKL